MKIKPSGIRILDKKDYFLSVNLQDILNVIENKKSFIWGFLYFKGAGYLKDGRTILDLEEQINKSERGLIIDWKGLNELANEKIQFFEVLIVGCQDLERIIRYTDDREMYECCDLVIELVDSSYWEIFSQDEALIYNLSIKFQETELINLSEMHS